MDIYFCFALFADSSFLRLIHGIWKLLINTFFAANFCAEITLPDITLFLHYSLASKAVFALCQFKRLTLRHTCVNLWTLYLKYIIILVEFHIFIANDFDDLFAIKKFLLVDLLKLLNSLLQVFFSLLFVKNLLHHFVSFSLIVYYSS